MGEVGVLEKKYHWERYKKCKYKKVSKRHSPHSDANRVDKRQRKPTKYEKRETEKVSTRMPRILRAVAMLPPKILNDTINAGQRISHNQ